MKFNCIVSTQLCNVYGKPHQLFKPSAMLNSKMQLCFLSLCQAKTLNRARLSKLRKRKYFCSHLKDMYCIAKKNLSGYEIGWLYVCMHIYVLCVRNLVLNVSSHQLQLLPPQERKSMYLYPFFSFNRRVNLLLTFNNLLFLCYRLFLSATEMIGTFSLFEKISLEVFQDWV